MTYNYDGSKKEIQSLPGILFKRYHLYYMKRFQIVLSPIILFLLLATVAVAQKSGNFNYYKSRLNLVFKLPNNLIEQDTTEGLYYPHQSESLWLGDFKLTTPDKNLLIAFDFFDADKTGSVVAPSYKYDENNYKKKINNMLDTSSHYITKNDITTIRSVSTILNSDKIHFLNTAELKKYGTDDGGFLDIPVVYPFRKFYHKIKVFFMYKKGEGEVYIYYFYNDGFPIDDYIKKNRYMLTFQNQKK